MTAAADDPGVGVLGGGRRLTCATIALVCLPALAPAVVHAAEPTWLVGTSATAGAARSVPGARLASGIRLVHSSAASARRLRRIPGVRFVERNRRFSASSVKAPSDPLFRRQWALRSAHVRPAWLATLGAGVPVAVLDSGIDLSNPDLAQNVWTNPGELPRSGVDDDRNGFIDDVHGADTVGWDGDPSDGLGHGTAVAGVIGARGDNAFGMSGVAWDVRLMPVKVLHDSGWGTTATMIAGLDYALANGARIVNMSLNGPDSSRALDDAIRQAERQGVLVVTSAGNDAANRDRVASYPASVRSRAVITVASATRSGALGHGSAWGRRSVDIAAPGEDIVTSDLGDSFTRHSGTSFAAAYVTGAAALLAALHPEASAARLRAVLIASARRGGRVDAAIAGGRLDASAAVRRLGRLRPR
jgi:subtilisin family serine protease